jgi:uncharacterized damage-inducible protein DinB
MITKPKPGDYSPFAAGYVGLVGDNDVIDMLEEQMETSFGLLSNLTDEQGLYAYAPGKWTVKQALGHMIDTERTFAYRALVFSRNHIELPGFDQDIYVNNADFNSQNIKDLADEFRALRQANLYMVKAFSDEQLSRNGIASNHPFTVAAFVFMLAGHERHHLNIFKDRYEIG